MDVHQMIFTNIEKYIVIEPAAIADWIICYEKL